MNTISYTLLGDGPSDRLLDYPIRWALRRADVRVDKGQWADFSRLRSKPINLADRIQKAIEYYPADIIFVHRDAEALRAEERLQEVREAVQGVDVPHVAVIPVRMTESWLLHDENAIRCASGNPRGKVDLELPKLERIEALLDPKRTLFEKLVLASELSGRRKSKLEKNSELSKMRMRTAELIEDFSSLLVVPAFASFVGSLNHALEGFEP